MNRFLKRGLPAMVAITAILSTVGSANAQQPPYPATQPPAAPQLAASQQPARLNTVDVMLVRNAITAVNHGNITGNFTVLRDLGSATFREKNTAATLASIFQNLRDRKVDLSPTLVLDPVFVQSPQMSREGFLQFVGYFPTRPIEVKFVVIYQKTDAGWMLDSISLATNEVPPQQPTGNPTPAVAARPAPRMPPTMQR